MKKIALCCIIYALCTTICCGIMNCGGVLYADYSPEITAKSALVLDYDSGTIVYEKNKDDRFPIASMVKLMTIYLTFKNIDEGHLSYDQKIKTSENASGMGGSQVFIDPYVEYSVEDLLKSVIISSANDASVALAETISGSEGAFVDLMNATAKNLGMTNTLYANATGLPSPEQYSSASDCATILKNVIKFDDYHKFSTIWMDELVHPSGRKTELVNTNKLIKYFEGCDGGKTGSTNEAGYCLSASAKRNNMRLISVIIGAKTGKDRFKESTELLNYGFANYENKEIINKGKILKEVQTSGCKQDVAEIVAMEDFYAFDKKGNKSAYDINYDLPEKISATKQGEIVGKVIISKDGKVVITISLTVKTDIDGMSLFDNFKQIIQNW